MGKIAREYYAQSFKYVICSVKTPTTMTTIDKVLDLLQEYDVDWSKENNNIQRHHNIEETSRAAIINDRVDLDP